MSRLRERCPGCSRRLITTRFDTTFRMSDRTERLCFGIPGGLCEDCHQLYIDPELIEVQDRLERGESPGSLVRSMRLQPFRAETLARQARSWTGPELDALVKGVGGRASTDARDRLAFDLWITDRVAPA